MDNSTATTPLQLEGELLLINQIDFVSTTAVAGTLYGIAFTLFCLYVHSLAPRFRGEDRKRQAKIMLAYSTVMMLCGLYYLVSNTWATQDAWIKHSDYPDSPFFYIQSTYHTPVVVVTLICELAIDTLTSAVQIWRVWIIWSATRYANLVTVVPILCFLTFTGLSLRTVILLTTLPAVKVVQLDTKAEIASGAIQGVITLLCTILISACLIFKQWQQRKLIGRTQGSTGYMGIVAILIESYALESIWLLFVVILWDRPTSVFFNESTVYMQIIAYLLVQYRVANGKAYGSQRGQTNVSSLRWNHSNHATTQFRETGEMHNSPHVSAIPEGSSAPRVSSMA